jgi:hypothetical protein
VSGLEEEMPLKLGRTNTQRWGGRITSAGGIVGCQLLSTLCGYQTIVLDSKSRLSLAVAVADVDIIIGIITMFTWKPQ